MIPEIAAILEMFKAGQCTMTQALGWIEQHMANADLRDHFAGQAMAALVTSGDEGAGDRLDDVPAYAYQIADEMIKARSA